MRYVAGTLFFKHWRLPCELTAPPLPPAPLPVCSRLPVCAGPRGSVREHVPRHDRGRHCRHLIPARTVAAQHVRRCVPVHGEASSYLEDAVGVRPIPSDSQTVRSESQEREREREREREL